MNHWLRELASKCEELGSKEYLVSLRVKSDRTHCSPMLSAVCQH